MAEKAEQEHTVPVTGHKETTATDEAQIPVHADEVATADWRVQAAVKDRWHSIKANPKIIFIALFAS